MTIHLNAHGIPLPVRHVLCLLLLFPLFPALQAKEPQLGQTAEISLLTVSPSEEEVYTVYGHTAIRVKDTAQKLDVIFNYGVFDFSKPNFVYRFTKGETDYRLAAYRTRDFLLEYEMRGSEVTEQVLALDSVGKAQIWEALLINNRPENRVYRYNFFFDNCATRPATLIEKQAGGSITYHDPFKPQTFREMINHCTRNKSWLTFGCDLVLGSPTDRLATTHEMLFLPLYLKAAFASATLTYPNAAPRQLVQATHTLVERLEEEEEPDPFPTPLTCSLLLLATILLVTGLECRRHTCFRVVDCLLFLIAGLAGTVLFFLSFISTHPSIWPNWNIVWLHPFHLAAVILFVLKKLRKVADYYHFINFAVLTLMLVCWYFIPQHLNPAFIPLIVCLWLRSGYGVYRKIWNIGHGKY